MSDTNGLTNNCQEDSTCETSCTKEKAHKLCRELLGGAWKEISCSEMIFRPITGGLVNALYYCSLPEDKIWEPHQVVLRVIGEFSKDDPNFVVTENVTFTILSERKMAPGLHGIFPGGRLEEYIPSLPLTDEQLRDPAISKCIAHKMAKLHSLNMPFNKEPTWLFHTIKSWFDRAHAGARMDNQTVEQKAITEKILGLDLEKEVKWLKSFLDRFDSPIVFCHNDLQKGNILLPEGPEDLQDRLMFIDYEFATYNYRGFDIALHFAEMGYDYTSPVHPYFAISRFPTKEEKLRFARAYLNSLGESKVEKVALLLEEIDGFMLACHMTALAWAACSGYTSKIKFGFLEYAQARLEGYFAWKKHVLQEYSKKETPQASSNVVTN